MRHVTLITTGGTIEKVYDERSGELSNRRSIVGNILERLRLIETDVHTLELMSKDSLDLTDADRTRIVEGVRLAGGDKSLPTDPPTSGVVILHGTDTLAVTGRRILADLPDPAVPIILTGAMRPFEMTKSDALQNLTEAIFATGVLAPGVYCVAHGRVLTFPNVAKDLARGTFVEAATEAGVIDSDRTP